MNQAVVKALAAAAVRWAMVVLGSHGVDLGDEQASALLAWLETGINGALIGVPLLWSAVHKVKVDRKIKGA